MLRQERVAPCFVRQLKLFPEVPRWAQIIAKSLKFAIHFVQQFRTPLPPNFKMAAFLSADQVREMVAQDVEMIEEENEETILVDKIKNFLEKVATPNIDA